MFEGPAFHTSNWDQTFEPAGKKIAVIGTGASAIQVVPAIAPVVDQLYVFQRTPPYITHRFDKNISRTTRSLHTKLPFIQRLKREFFYWFNEFFGLGFLGSKTLNRFMRFIALRKLHKEVKDTATRKQLTPAYTIGCKRILRSDDYYPTFNLDQVHLITEPVERFTKDGLITKDGRSYALDAVVYATGFEAADLQLGISITGLNGRDLVEHWQETGGQAYLGTTVSGFPNLGLLLGPNTGLGHNSILHMIKSQMNYLVQYIQHLEAADTAYLDLLPQVQHDYNERLQQRLQSTVWAAGCRSWYMNAMGKNTTLYPGLTLTFRKETRRFDALKYTARSFDGKD